MSRRRRAPPIVHHLRREHGIKPKAHQILPQNQPVIHLLQRREDPRQRSGAEHEHLYQSPTHQQIHPLHPPHSPTTESETRRAETGIQPPQETYRKSTQLPRPPIPPHLPDLRPFARRAQHPRPSLQSPQHPLAHHPPLPQTPTPNHHPRHKRPRRDLPPLIPQHQHRHRHILHRDQRRLAVGREGEAAARAVGEGDEVGGRLEGAGERGDAAAGAGGAEFEELGDLDDGGGEDDGEAEGFGEGEAQAGGGEVEVVD